MLRVLLVTDSISLNTGYANTAKLIVDALLEAKCDVRQLAWGITEEPPNSKIKIYPTSPNDFYGKSLFKDVVEDFLPQIVLSFGDIFNIGWIGNYPNRFFKWMAYFPIDAEHLTIAQKHIIQQIDAPIVYTKNALSMVISETKREDLKIIYHGIDTEKFKPLDKDEVKRKYGLQNKFIVGTVGRNNARKNFPALMESFAKFALDKPDAVLYLHTKPVDVGHNLYEYIKKYNLSNKVYFTQDMDGVIGLNDEELVELYNCFDVFVSTTAGEGLGLPILEAQSCKVPVLATDYSAIKEFVPKKFRIKVKATYHEPFWDVERAIVDQEDLVDKLNSLYYNKHILPIIGESARMFVQNFDWKYIIPLWIYFIQLYAEQQFGIKMEEDTNSPLDKFIRI
jgi:glycosyltransferase involved in cell wall biosynthesis